MPSDVDRRQTANVVPDVSCRGFKPGDRKKGTIVPRATNAFPTTAAGRPLILESFAQIELVRALLLVPADDRWAVALSTPCVLRLRLSVERRPVRWRSGLLPLPRLLPPRPHLSARQVIDGRLDRDLKPRCRGYAALRYLCQGFPGGGPSTVPGHPRAMSDARMVASEFPSSLAILPE